MDKKQIVFEMIKANNSMELMQFFTLMLDYKMHADETHNLLLELESEGKLKINKIYDRKEMDIHYNYVSTYQYFVEIL